jgi:hypothetical protein
MVAVPARQATQAGRPVHDNPRPESGTMNLAPVLSFSLRTRLNLVKTVGEKLFWVNTGFLQNFVFSRLN